MPNDDTTNPKNTSDNHNSVDTCSHADMSLAQLPKELAALLRQALESGVTDIHLDPAADEWLIRSRAHGDLMPGRSVESAEGRRFANQAKAAAGLRPDRLLHGKEGRIRLRTEHGAHDIRVSVVPTVEGEAVHLRLLSARWNWHNLTQLGFSKKDAALVAETLSSQTGLILVAGATGGGKTTTLYSLTTVVDVGGKVIASIEDPVEYAIPGVRQIQVDSEHGFTMSEGLRLLLRMDPDMILVGEIRDPASANIAARASLTGALVAATIHAPDSFGAVAALQHLSVPKYVIGGALRMIITQELLPTLCLQCIELRAITPDERLAFDAHGLTPPDALKESRGCHACHGLGRAGRTAVAEILPVSMAAGQEIASGAVRSGLARCLEESRESTLARNALLRAAEGVVPMNSVQRLILSRRGSKTGGVGNE